MGAFKTTHNENYTESNFMSLQNVYSYTDKRQRLASKKTKRNSNQKRRKIFSRAGQNFKKGTFLVERDS